MQERKSLLAMKQLLDHTVEVLALWKVLCDHQLHLLGQSLSAEMRMSLKTTLFRDLILSGSDTCIGLINSLIHRYLDDAASTDAISEKLRQVCPSLYRNEVTFQISRVQKFEFDNKSNSFTRCRTPCARK
jgi:nuclear pore complex protein Nup155